MMCVGVAANREDARDEAALEILSRLDKVNEREREIERKMNRLSTYSTLLTALISSRTFRTEVEEEEARDLARRVTTTSR